MQKTHEILKILDDCAESFTFPMLDNGYVYLAKTRLSLYRSYQHWAMVIEVFGYMNRAEFPEIALYTFSDALCRENKLSFKDEDSLNQHLEHNPHNEMHTVFPIDEGKWQEGEEFEMLAVNEPFDMRGRVYQPLSVNDYPTYSVELEIPNQPYIYEFCRLLAALYPDKVSATEIEKKEYLADDMSLLLVLDEWHHPDIAFCDKPSKSETFEQLARVLETGDLSHYKPTIAPNTHLETLARRWHALTLIYYVVSQSKLIRMRGKSFTMA